MPLPLATLTNTTATGDVIAAPGATTVLAGSLPVSCLGDAVTGAVCVGAVANTPSMTVLAGARPVTVMTSQVVGVNPITGVPVTTVVLSGVSVTILA